MRVVGDMHVQQRPVFEVRAFRWKRLRLICPIRPRHLNSSTYAKLHKLRREREHGYILDPNIYLSLRTFSLKCAIAGRKFRAPERW